MTTIVTRSGKGSPLTHTEVDTNFTNLNTAKLETAAIPLGTLQAPSVSFLNDSDTGIFCPQGGNSLAIATGGQYAITCSSTQAVGIKTANPQGALQVAGSTRIGANDATDAFLEIGEGATGNRNSYIDIVGDTTYTDYGLRVIRNNTGANATSELKHRGTGALNFTTEEAAPIVFYTTNSPSMTITSGGLVGIGTSSPAFAVDISAPSDAIVRSRTNGNTSAGFIGSTNNGTNNWFLGSRKDSVGGSSGTDRFNLLYDTSTYLTVTTAGNVGIGTTTPAAALHVTSSNPGGYGTILYNTSSTGEGLTIRAGSTSSHNILVAQDYNASATRLSVSSVGTTTLNAATATAPFIANIGASEVIRIDSSGRLLVGTSSNANGGQVEAKTATVEGGNPAYDKKAFIAQIPYATTNITSSLLAGFDSNIHGVDLGYRYNGTGYDLCFATNSTTIGSPTERMRINSAGHTKFTTDGAYTGIDANTHGFRQTVTANWTLFCTNSSAAPVGIVMDYTGATPNNTSSFFLYCSDSTAVRANIRSNGGLANFQSNDVNLSDRNVKKDISPAANTWNCIKEWEIVNYRYKDQPDDANLNVGVIAQQVAESCPEVITIFQEAKDATEDKPAQEERLGVREQQMYWMAIKALQEAMGRIETLEQRLTAAGID